MQNYRCFGPEEQTARLAPLTLLVGPNSTGKTSFLALIRALWDVAFREVVPNFREEPFDLGSFEEIVHKGGKRDRPEESFCARFEFRSFSNAPVTTMLVRTTFQNFGGAPFPMGRDIARGGDRVEVRFNNYGKHELRCTSGGQAGNWRTPGTANSLRPNALMSIGDSLESDTPDAIFRLCASIWQHGIEQTRPFAGAPARSVPRRTYDPVVLAHDAEGDSIPSYLANVSRRAADEWQLLKGGLEDFGRASGLFDQISVRSFGKSDGDPFQIQIRKFGKRRKGPWRNLIDVGYGVSQALPVLVEMLRSDAAGMLLLQQPEVHLHPQAQAALGTLFCQVAAGGRQLVVETHSDYIIDRVRMDVRDQTTGLKPEDVSILYFEPRDLDVKIHSIRIDQAGNVLDAPLSYGKFFMAETRRSIGL